MSKPLLMVDFVTTGHHAIYIRHLVRFRMRSGLNAIAFLIPRELCDRVVTQLSPLESRFFIQGVRMLEDDPAWRRIRRWAGSDDVARCVFLEYLNFFEGRKSSLFFLFLETVFYQIALSPLPRFNVSGLMFRPTFYYARHGMLVGGTRSRVVFLMKWTAAYVCAKRPGISQILTLDPLAQEHARSRWDCRKFQVIPDPFGPEAGMPRPMGVIRQGPRPSLTLLIAGVLGRRKGIREVVRALLYSPEDIRRRVILVVAGEMDTRDSDYVSENLEQLEKNGGNVVADLRLITGDELDAYIQRSDAVLTAYRGFKGSSGILIRAAHFGKPVISTSEGLLGYFVRRHALGQAIHVEDSKTFATCIEKFLLTGNSTGFDPAEARRFADNSDPELFAENVIRKLSS